MCDAHLFQTRPIGNLTALPTIPESPRKHKRKAVELDSEQEEDPALSESPTVQRSNDIEDRIRFAKALEPNRQWFLLILPVFISF